MRPPAVDRLAAQLRTIHREARRSIERLASVKFAERRETRTHHGELFARCGDVFGEIAVLDAGNHRELKIAPVCATQMADPQDSVLTSDLRALQTTVAVMLDAMDQVWPQKASRRA
jgi:hypothetical protein